MNSEENFDNLVKKEDHCVVVGANSKQKSQARRNSGKIVL